MLLQFSEEKWDDMISSGKSLGEILYENDAKKRKALDIEFNKNNRVTVAQFASKKAIANTPRSPRFNDSISHSPAVVNSEFEEIDSQGKKLTPEQQEYYKDSKIRDKDGCLLSADGKRVGDGLFQILSPLWDEKNETWNEKLFHEFSVYITNLHNIDRQREDKPVIFYTTEDNYKKHLLCRWSFMQGRCYF